MLKRTLLLITLICPAGAQAAVYQCTVNGQTVFSDRPCGNDSKELDHKPAPALGGQFDTGVDSYFEALPQEEKKPRVQQQKDTDCPPVSATELRTLIIKKRVVEGMKKDDVRRAWGAPTSIMNSGSSSQWNYHWSNGNRQYVHFRNGCVSSTSSYKRN